MKRIICALLLVVSSAALFACSQKETIRQPVEFYYCAQTISYNSTTGVIAPETRESDGLENDPEALIDLYLRGPVHEEYYSPFPQNIKVLNINIDTNTATVMLSKDYSKLSGYQLTLACACLAKTVIGITGSETVRIGAQDALLDGNAYIQMSDDTLALMDQYTALSNN